MSSVVFVRRDLDCRLVHGSSFQCLIVRYAEEPTWQILTRLSLLQVLE